MLDALIGLNLGSWGHIACLLDIFSSVLVYGEVGVKDPDFIEEINNNIFGARIQLEDFE